MLIVYGLVLIAVVMDLRKTKISNRLILVGLGISLIRRVVLEGGVGILIWLFQISFPVVILYLFYLMGALGAGDLKLFSLIAGFINFKELCICIISAFVVGGVFSFLKMLWEAILFSGMKNGLAYGFYLLQGNLAPYPKPEDKKHYIHFSIPILCGLIYATIGLRG